MSQALNEIKYFSRDIRQTKCYIFFQILQLLLASLIIVQALTSRQHFKGFTVIILEYCLLTLMTIDMLIRLAACGLKKIYKSKGNLVDLCILVFFGVTLLCLTILREEESTAGKNEDSYEKILETDDIIIISIVLARYAVQISRTICMIRETHKNMKCRENIQKLDLNVQSANNCTLNVDSFEQDQIIKNKIIQLGQTQRDGLGSPGSIPLALE